MFLHSNNKKLNNNNCPIIEEENFEKKEENSAVVKQFVKCNSTSLDEMVIQTQQTKPVKSVMNKMSLLDTNDLNAKSTGSVRRNSLFRNSITEAIAESVSASVAKVVSDLDGSFNAYAENEVIAKLSEKKVDLYELAVEDIENVV